MDFIDQQHPPIRRAAEFVLGIHQDQTRPRAAISCPRLKIASAADCTASQVVHPDKPCSTTSAQVRRSS